MCGRLSSQQSHADQAQTLCSPFVYRMHSPIQPPDKSTGKLFIYLFPFITRRRFFLFRCWAESACQKWNEKWFQQNEENQVIAKRDLCKTFDLKRQTGISSVKGRAALGCCEICRRQIYGATKTTTTTKNVAVCSKEWRPFGRHMLIVLYHWHKLMSKVIWIHHERWMCWPPATKPTSYSIFGVINFRVFIFFSHRLLVGSM